MLAAVVAEKLPGSSRCCVVLGGAAVVRAVSGCFHLVAAEALTGHTTSELSEELCQTSAAVVVRAAVLAGAHARFPAGLHNGRFKSAAALRSGASCCQRVRFFLIQQLFLMLMAILLAGYSIQS